MKETEKTGEEERTYLKGLGLAGAFGGALAVVHVKNGRIIRVRPLDYTWKYRPEEFNYDAWRIEGRGKIFNPPLKSLVPPFSLAYKKRAYSPNRVKYPLKRVDFDPKGERHPENRGKSGFVRISWDEALDIITGEIKRIKKTYGPAAILCPSHTHGQSQAVHMHTWPFTRLLKLYAGEYTQDVTNPDSWEGYYWGAKHVWGFNSDVGEQPQQNLLRDVLQNTELMLFWGCDPETTPWGFGVLDTGTVWANWFREAGIKCVYICPDLNYGAAVHADRWIPIRPNTDAAMHLAIAHVWMTEGSYEKEYVYTHGYGFDEFKKYVLGEEDGAPKTPRWAEEITGVPSRITKALAREWASKRTSIVVHYGGPKIRGPYSHEPGRLEVLLLAMQGVGRPGVNQFRIGGTGYPKPIISLPRMIPHTTPFERQFIPRDLIPDAILDAPISWYGTTYIWSPTEDQFKKYTYPVEGYPEVHMIWEAGGGWITCWNCGNRMIEAFRSPKIEFVLNEHPWLEDDSLFADIVLPVTTIFEVEDIKDGRGNLHTVYYMARCIEPIGESKSDYEISCMIAERLDIKDEFTEGKTVEEWIKALFNTAGVSKFISWDEFKKNQYFVVPIDPEWKKVTPGIRWYHELPEGKGLETPTGKIEFYSTGLAKHLPDDSERPPVPHWIPYGESHQESLSHPRARRYPLLIVSNHPRWRLHANGDDISWLREIVTCKIRGSDGYQYEPLWIHPTDAAQRKVEHGDIVNVYNERGSVLGGAYVTERIMPGVVYMADGARYDPISIEDKIDRGGAINTICPRKVTSTCTTGMVTSGYLVDVEKADLGQLKKKYPDVFKRPFDPAAGQCYESWVK